ncbi:NAD(P)H-dependent flavin oxidoreductase [Roseospira goensis]|uniref:Enoyl-[acyl-carrier protein] reductase II n=1 Tax=Roseospira goensis TaxID=391922 RepID=A0A7W6RZ70_9PROT|nr:nitronate monooxygenase [Roseospira goensis]MBB4285951.1 enoyl-[acyl-carrier protein] reductase II [Roseospira goensis]
MTRPPETRRDETPRDETRRDETPRQHLDRLWARGRALLGTDTAIMGGAMSWVSERTLVAAISNAGGFGVLACGSMGPDLLAAEIEATQALTDRPFGVNLITMHPELDALVDVCLARSVGHVVLAGGLPAGATIRRLKDGGARVLCFAPATALARKLIRLGVDGLIIEGAEAGGHIGPVSTSVLAQEILPAVGAEIPVFVAGGIGRGEAIVSYLEMGASGVQLGTHFVCATESIAHPAFKAAFIKASARDAVPSVQLDQRFPVIPVRALRNKATERFMAAQQEAIDRFRAGAIDQKAAQLEIEHFWAGALRRAVIDGDVESGSLMAGQSVGLVKEEQPTQAIIDTLIAQAEATLAARAGVAGEPARPDAAAPEARPAARPEARPEARPGVAGAAAPAATADPVP